jgi:multiple sugar transport system ATP-binding protein
MGDRIVVMNNGYIQQVDAPRQLYDHPKNLFVAGFIGTSPMNLMDAIVVKCDDGFYVSTGKDMLPVLPDRLPDEKIAPYEGKAVVIGIRPEDLSPELESVAWPNSGYINIKVELVEMTGSEILLYTVSNESTLIARVPVKHNYLIGDSIRLAVNSSKMHIFDKETQEVIG